MGCGIKGEKVSFQGQIWTITFKNTTTSPNLCNLKRTGHVKEFVPCNKCASNRVSVHNGLGALIHPRASVLKVFGNGNAMVKPDGGAVIRSVSTNLLKTL